LLVSFLHGCSSEVLKTELQIAPVKSHKKLQWGKICQFHSSVVIDLLETGLEQVAKGHAQGWGGGGEDTARPEHAQVWENWSDLLGGNKSAAVRKLLQQNDRSVSERLLALAIKYPLQGAVRDRTPKLPKFFSSDQW
jgi:hypothetical protein